MSRLATGLSAFILAPLLVAGCDEPTSAPPASRPRLEEPRKEKPAAPVPQTVEDVAKLGVPVYPGSTLSDSPERTRLDDSRAARVYFAKMYAPGQVAEVLGFYVKNVEGARASGGIEQQQVLGTTKDGDKLDVRIAPAADKTKSLVMVWLTQPKAAR